MFVKGMEQETQLLVAVGAAVASGCQPCLEKIVGQARKEGVAERKLQSAAVIGQFVKDQPAQAMKQLADALLGTHLNGRRPDVDRPMEGEPGHPVAGSLPSGCGCGCSAA